MNTYDNYFAANKLLWNQRTTIHKDSSFYNLAGFKNGDTVLTPIELNEVGNVQGKKMLHLQCHFGMDSLNWARLGADVTGVDISDVAISEAKKLNDELGLNAKFICANVYDLDVRNADSKIPSADWPIGEAFDIVFTSYGTIGWLPDLDKWAAIIAHYLKPGGIFFIAEFHPVVWMFDDEFTHIKYYYNNREVIVTENQGTYTDSDIKSDIKVKEYGWNHGLSEVVNALISAGLKIESLNEFNYSPYPCFSNTIETEKRKWQIKGMEGKIPMVYSIVAKRE